MADGKAFGGLRRSLRGPVILPGDSGYEQHRQVWNLDVNRFPAAIARCADEEDVRAAVRFAVEAGVADVAVRGGGHSYQGLSTCDGGLVIDLGLMQGARVAANNRIFVQGGAKIGHLDAAAAQIGAAVPAGVEASTGVAGLTLGGGVGALKRRFGLTCDSLRSVRMVTADGAVVVADDNTEPDLMWGLRGGGGNFGIVTEFEFVSFPVAPYIATYLMYPMDKISDFAPFFDEYVAGLPKEISSCSLIPHLLLKPSRGVDSAAVPADISAAAPPEHFAVNTLWLGAPDEMAAALGPLGAWRPAANISRRTTHIKMQSSMPKLGLPQNRYVRGGYLDRLGTGAICDLAVEPTQGSPPGTVVFSAQGGAIAEVGEQDTAFTGRSARFMYTIEASWLEPSAREQTVAWVRDRYDRIEKYATGGNYSNIVTDEGSADGQRRVRQLFGDEKFCRLQRLKSAWDPGNLFHLNLNIPPATRV